LAHTSYSPQSIHPPLGPLLYNNMAPKRKRNASVPPKGLAPGELLKRNAITSASPWGWVGTEVTDLGDITLEHRMSTCSLSQRNDVPYCRSKFSATEDANSPTERQLPLPSVDGELDDDIIVMSDDERPSCSKKLCKTNPNCLNYLGQQKWEDEGNLKLYVQQCFVTQNYR
jgi:ubiquitin carboxyl-terminal hydrolase 48